MQMFVLFLLCCASGPVSVLVAHVERQPPSAPRDREEYESQFPAQLKADPYGREADHKSKQLQPH
jgi:hypothetical protein